LFASRRWRTSDLRNNNTCTIRLTRFRREEKSRSGWHPEAEEAANDGHDGMRNPSTCRANRRPRNLKEAKSKAAGTEKRERRLSETDRINGKNLEAAVERPLITVKNNAQNRRLIHPTKNIGVGDSDKRQAGQRIVKTVTAPRFGKKTAKDEIPGALSTVRGIVRIDQIMNAPGQQ